MTTLITGGSKCGKSRFAESRFDNFKGRKLYVAAMRPYGAEALAAIERHRQARLGKGFETVEKYTDIDEIRPPDGCGILLECIANLCANEMFPEENAKNPLYPADKIVRGLEYLSARSELLVIVTCQVGGDGILYEKTTSEYIRAMGEINRRAAEMSDNVIECVYGVPIVLKGKLI